MKLPIRYLTLIALAGVLVALDQVVKIYVHSSFHLGETVTVIPGFFNITYVRNPGAAFGFLAKTAPAFREAFFLIVPPLAMIIIIQALKSVADSDKPQTIALSLIFGGALGNYIDRLRFSYVIDYLDFHYQGRLTWPAFNVADMSIVSGVILLFLIMFLSQLKNRQIKNQQASS